MGIESPTTDESNEDLEQKQLAQDYLAAYADYKKINDRRMNDLRILDKLRDEVAPQEMLDEQQKLFDSSRDEEKMAMERYARIGDKLKPETKDKYLK